MKFKEWLISENKLPLILQGLAAEARKCSSFEEFEKDFGLQIKHGLYWHWTDDPDFRIDPAKGPRDMSSMSSNQIDAGKLMITSHLAYWSNYGPKGKGREYAAIIDMSDVPRKSYYQVSRGFGNEFYVSDPSKAKVIKVVTRQQAFRIDREQKKYIPQSEEELKNFYLKVTQFKESIKSEGFFDYVKAARNLVPTPIYKNPTSEELKNKYNEVRMFLIEEDVYSWQTTELLHGEVARMLNLNKNRIPLIGVLYNEKIFNVFVTDDSKNTIWHENPDVVNSILSNKNFMNVTVPGFNSRNIEFYNQDVVGDWKNITSK